jgi:tetratricopeptide (TPR) repeat protein
MSLNPDTVAAAADDFPMDGLPLPFLRELINGNGGESAFEDMTTSDVKRSIIVPLTQATKLSLCAQLKQAGDARVLPATWFVSHPWQIKFSDLVKALELFFADKPGAVIWLDLFSTSQHSTFDKPPEWWQQTFCSAIGRMGQMVMVMTPWDSPVALTRAWCLIELYACRSSGSSFGVALPPSERARFLTDIVQRASEFHTMLSKVNTANSECSRETDRQRIFAAVRGLDGGFTALDRGVLKTMTEWLELQLRAHILEAASDGRVHEECRAINAMGQILRMNGEYDRAQLLHEECLEKQKRIFGDDHIDTIVSLNNLAQILASKHQYDRAQSLLEECLEKRKRIFGDDHIDILFPLSNLALLFRDKGEYDRAQPLLEECLEKRKRIFGDNHPDTLYALNNLAQIFRDKGDYDRAQPLLEECLEKRKRILGDDHPDTLYALNNLAAAFASQGEYDRAQLLHEECLEKRKRIFGDDHPDTLLSLNNLAATSRSKGDYDKAQLLFEECVEKLKRILGDDHPNTMWSHNSLAFTFFLKGEVARALPLFEAILAQAKAVLGHDHPHIQVFKTRRDNCALKLAGA